MSYEFYKVLHLASIFGIFLSLGAAIFGSQFGLKKGDKGKKLIGITHGVGLTIALVAGFGLLARTGFKMSEGWVLVKLFVWLSLGALPALINRRPQAAPITWILILGFGVLASVMATTKPF